MALGGLVHSGFLSSAQWFIDNVLSQLVSFATLYGVKSLIVVGHSLGGATAALLTIMLQDYLHVFPPGFKVHCYSYGPPSCVSLELAKRSEEHVDCFVFADDLVPRLCFGTVMDLKAMVLCTVENSQSYFKELMKVNERFTCVR